MDGQTDVKLENLQKIDFFEHKFSFCENER